MPQRFFDEIGDTKEGLLAFFKKHFPDVISLIGEEKLVADYFRNSKLPLISIKVIKRANRKLHVYCYR